MDAVFTATAFLKEGRVSSRPAKVVLREKDLLIEAGSSSAIWPYGSLVFSPGGDDRQYLIVTSPSSDRPIDSLVVNDASLVAALAGKTDGPGRDRLLAFENGRRGALRAKWSQMAAALLILAAFLVLSFVAIEKVLVKEVVKRTPIPTEVAWGGKLVGLATAGRIELKKGPAFDAAQEIWSRLVRAAKKDNPGYPMVLHVIRDPTVNAFALPGGQVVLLTGLMEKAESPEEVAGVLAHEMQHVLKRHVAGRIAQSLGTRLWVSFLFGGGDLSALTLSAQQLGELSYGRGQETEADIEGAKLMAAAGLPPAALGSFFRRLGKEEKAAWYLPSFLSTHPASAKRAKRLDDLAGKVPVPHPRPFSMDWGKVKRSLPPP